MTYDVTIVGAGIVGLATAYQLKKKNPKLKILILEKEKGPAFHQTGRNSGVIHSGIYYRPGSYKAKLCREGYQELLDLFREFKLPFDLCGKIIVATDEEEVVRLKALQKRGEENGLKGMTYLEEKDISKFENRAKGLAGLHVPQTGIVDYGKFCEILTNHLKSDLGVDIRFYHELKSIVSRGDEKIIQSGEKTVSRFLINCAGLQSDRVALLDGVQPPCKIVPFRGEYYELKPEAVSLVKNLIYPVPDPAFPFLGVHFTRMVDGSVECGPNAVLAFKREGYSKLDISASDLFDTFTYGGFWKLAGQHWKMGLGEFHRSFSKKAFVKALQKMLPSIREEHLVPAPSGVRAQALGPDGKTIDDFLFAEGSNSLHVLNAPSPAATASLAIGREIVRRYEASLN